MTTAPERRTATLTELVAQEIDSVRGRKRMSQAQLARAMGKSPMWVSLRLRGLQPIDLNDLQRFARALGVDVHDLLPDPGKAASASVSVRNPHPAVRSAITQKPASQRPRGRDDSRRPGGLLRTARLPRPDLS